MVVNAEVSLGVGSNTSVGLDVGIGAGMGSGIAVVAHVSSDVSIILSVDNCIRSGGGNGVWSVAEKGMSSSAEIDMGIDLGERLVCLVL